MTDLKTELKTTTGAVRQVLKNCPEARADREVLIRYVKEIIPFARSSSIERLARLYQNTLKQFRPSREVLRWRFERQAQMKEWLREVRT